MKSRAAIIGELMNSLRYERVDQPLSRRTRLLVAQLDESDDGSITRTLNTWRPVGAVATPR